MPIVLCCNVTKNNNLATFEDIREYTTEAACQLPQAALIRINLINKLRNLADTRLVRESFWLQYVHHVELLYPLILVKKINKCTPVSDLFIFFWEKKKKEDSYMSKSL